VALEYSVENLQVVLDAAFVQAERAPQRPSVEFTEREKGFQEKASRIGALKQARMNSTQVGSPLASMLFEVVRHRGHWRILHRSKHSAPFPGQVEAIQAAKALARKKLTSGHPVEVRLNRTDGQVVAQPIEDNSRSLAATSPSAVHWKE
jgi:hypothetical protein